MQSFLYNVNFSSKDLGTAMVLLLFARIVSMFDVAERSVIAGLTVANIILSRSFVRAFFGSLRDLHSFQR